MKKKTAFWLSLILTPFILVIGLYLGLAAYYHNEFSYGTFINDVYCTGKNIEVVNQLLKDQSDLPQIKVTDMNGRVELIDSSQIDYQIDYSAHLKHYIKNQNSFLWGMNLIENKKVSLVPSADYNEELLIENIKTFSIIREGSSVGKAEVSIVKDENGYSLKETVTNVPDVPKIIQYICDSVKEGQVQIVLDETFYEDREMTEEMEETLLLWDKVKEFQKCGITYQMGESLVPINAAITSQWILTDEKGGFVLDEKGELQLKEGSIKEFIDSLAEEYDTYNVPREFQSTRGDLITIEKGTYGNKINRKKETTYLEEAFFSKKEEIRIPEYEQTALYQGTDDIGDTYIEIDMTEQIMYYYVKGEKVIETPIVTGNVSQGHRTPTRICAVYAKQTDRILRGPGYASPVKFWVPIYGNIGIHDASWRNEFGGEIYKTNGSHGCINTPYDAMSELFDQVEIGTPAIMFY